ncbi:MAG: hypothetical protein O7G88_20245 [bacterium]|nr:hypothetical protein [bacterium]
MHPGRVRSEARQSPHWPTVAGVRVRRENKILVPAARLFGQRKAELLTHRSAIQLM